MDNELDMIAIQKKTTYKLLSKTPITNKNDAINILSEELKLSDREIFCIINMNAGGQPINASITSIGTLSAAVVHPREVYKAALLSNAAAVILLHNHPSGNPNPSKEDMEVTERLVHAGRIIGVEVIDHIIVGEESNYSFRENGYLEIKYERDELQYSNCVVEAFLQIPYEEKFKAVVINEFPELTKNKEALDNIFLEHMKNDSETGLLNISVDIIKGELKKSEIMKKLGVQNVQKNSKSFSR